MVSYTTQTAAADKFSKPAALPDQKRLGAFYTPDAVAEVLVRWALAGRAGRVLEPSFGGCSFLRASLGEIRRVGGSSTQIVGVDIDREATREATAALVAAGLPAENLLYRDFLALTPAKLGLFAAVAGNPPYVRHQWLHPDWRRNAQGVVASTGVSLSHKASAWAYFVIHAVRFVEAKGRLALVLPGAVLHAHYARALLEHLTGQFGSVRFLRLRERLFTGAEEEVVVLLAADRGSRTSSARVEDVVSVDALADSIADGQAAATLVDIKTGLLPRATRELISEALAREEMVQLGALATVRIGVVTGANDFFVRSKDQLPGVVGTKGIRLAGRSAWLRGPEWTSRDLDHHERLGRKTRLLAIDPDWRRRGGLAAEIDEAEKTGVHERHHTAKRGERWWVLDDLRVPQAFLPYMGTGPRGLVLNRTKATCTNTIHRVDFHGLTNPRAACASTWTALFDVCAELAGRHYGGGVLKLEPTAAQSLPVSTAAVDSDQLEHALSLFSTDRPTEGRMALDRLFLQEPLGLTVRDIEALRGAAAQLAKWRVQAPRKPSG